MSETLHVDSIEPSAEQLKALQAIDPEGPFHFVNFLAFKDEAEYPAEHKLAKAKLSGSDAYDKYGAVALAQIIQRGGRLITLNTVELEVIGSSGPWHRVATMEYPNIAAFLDMIADPVYQQALVHRDAGLKDTIVLVTRPQLKAPIG
ncbi:hypothetical protein DOK_07214 [gamma proteobacterium BDW918]|jgi:uncharacterized protein (DUF1330 family)|uniref:DUF1330 domain-containing protein n=1 Tax=Zhongshania aliphaticivorans TaxID=1470434 RepID=A0A127M770_9GAMM|nr:DUF1330 domain-containing protein [Zhongshania aliphaticivorans]AMO69087.1 hypothetical protein AZF00_12580 [Zhongshania aliphaticivorans]EIF43647.1 hypothetical protein DOK_07214 [gamma proteobacterium BDW918]|tara:strand:+ start:3786 stop:4226 length:441 start_codon:yes stop_codon:yes gene_type:complete